MAAGDDGAGQGGAGQGGAGQGGAGQGGAGQGEGTIRWAKNPVYFGLVVTAAAQLAREGAPIAQDDVVRRTRVVARSNGKHDLANATDVTLKAKISVVNKVAMAYSKLLEKHAEEVVSKEGRTPTEYQKLLLALQNKQTGEINDTLAPLHQHYPAGHQSLTELFQNLQAYGDALNGKAVAGAQRRAATAEERDRKREADARVLANARSSDLLSRTPRSMATSSTTTSSSERIGYAATTTSTSRAPAPLQLQSSKVGAVLKSHDERLLSLEKAVRSSTKASERRHEQVMAQLSLLVSGGTQAASLRTARDVEEVVDDDDDDADVLESLLARQPRSTSTSTRPRHAHARRGRADVEAEEEDNLDGDAGDVGDARNDDDDDEEEEDDDEEEEEDDDDDDVLRHSRGGGTRKRRRQAGSRR